MCLFLVPVLIFVGYLAQEKAVFLTSGEIEVQVCCLRQQRKEPGLSDDFTFFALLLSGSPSHYIPKQHIVASPRR